MTGVGLGREADSTPSRNSVKIRVANRASLHVLEWSRQAFPCVFVHGFGDAACVWHQLATRLEPRFRTLAIDLRGQGNSDWDPEGRYDSKEFIEVVGLLTDPELYPTIWPKTSASNLTYARCTAATVSIDLDVPKPAATVGDIICSKMMTRQPYTRL
jgi:pimeloyl-ACP methyl ester carboxylesterase